MCVCVCVCVYTHTPTHIYHHHGITMAPWSSRILFLSVSRPILLCHQLLLTGLPKYIKCPQITNVNKSG